MSNIVWKDCSPDKDIVITFSLTQIRQIALVLRGDILSKFAEAQRMADTVSSERQYPMMLCVDLMRNDDFQKCLDMLDPEFPGLVIHKIFDYWGIAAGMVANLKLKIQQTSDWKNYHRS